MNLLKRLYVKQNPTYKKNPQKYAAIAYNESETQEFTVFWEVGANGVDWNNPSNIRNSQGKDVLEDNKSSIKTRYEVKFMFFEPKEELNGGQTRKKLFFELPEYDEYSFYAQGADEDGNRYKIFWKAFTKAPECIKREDGTDCTNEDWELVYDEKLYEYNKLGRTHRYIITKSVNGWVTVIGTEKFLPVAMKVMHKDFDKAPKENTRSLTAHFGRNILCVNEKSGDKTEWNVIDLFPFMSEKNN